MVSIFFMLLKIPRFLHLLLLLLRIYSPHKVEIRNKTCWRIFKMPLLRSVILLKVHFLKGLEDMSQNFLHKDREHIRTPVVHVQKRPQHYMTNLIDAILSVISDFITEQRISAIDFNPLFSSLGK